MFNIPPSRLLEKLSKFGAALEPNPVKRTLCNARLTDLRVQEELRALCPDLVVSPAGLPHAQSLGVGKLAFKAQQDPAVAEEQLEAVLPQPGQVLVEAGKHESQQFPQVHLGAGHRGNTPRYNYVAHTYFPRKFIFHVPN